jgi:hypothetical protein
MLSVVQSTHELWAFQGGWKTPPMRCTSSMKTFTLAVALALVSAGCSSKEPSAVPQSTTNLSGSVYLAGGPSPGTKIPLANINLRFSAGGKPVTQVFADAAGSYTVELAPGNYEAHPVTANCPGLVRITVPSTPTASIDIPCPIP